MATPLLARMVSTYGSAILARVPTAKEKAADELLAGIKADTAAGKGSNGRPFASYAASTAKQKGRTRPVALRASGDMLDDYQVRVRGKEVRIGFSQKEQQDKARFHAFGTRNMPQRRFTQPTLQRMRKAAETFRQEIRVALKTDRRTAIKLNFFDR